MIACDFTLAGKRQNGFSLVELMIAMTIGLLLLAGVSYVMLSTSQTRTELDRTGRQIESGRYAMQVLDQDIRLAGFYGRLSELPSASSTPDPCDTSLAELREAISLPVFGYDESSSTLPSCITDRLAGTDVLVVRRAASTAYAPTSAPDNGVYIQSSAKQFIVDQGNNASAFTLKKKDASLIPVRRYLVHIYWISSCNVPAGANCNGTTDDGGRSIPTLKMLELDPAGANGFTTHAIAEGIENLQFDYGIDSTGTDGLPDGSPDDYSTCVNNSCDGSWENVTAIRINLLARNPEPTVGYEDNKTYTLGLTGEVNVSGDNYKRHVYQGLSRLNNIAGRREL